MQDKIKIITTIVAIVFGAIQLTIAQVYNVQKLDSEKGKPKGTTFMGVDKDGFMYWSSTKTKNHILFKTTQPWIKVTIPASGSLYTQLYIDNKRFKEKGYKYLTTMFLEEHKLLLIMRKNEGTDEEKSKYFGVEMNQIFSQNSAVFELGEKPYCKGFNSGKQKEFSEAVTYYRDDKGLTTFLSEVACEWDKNPSFVAITFDDNYTELAKQKFELPIENNIVETQFVRYKEDLVLNVKSLERVNIDRSTFGDLILINRLFLVKQDGIVELISNDLEPDKVPAQVVLEVRNDELLITGQLIKTNTTVLLGLFSAKYNPDNQIFETTNQTLFSEEYVEKFLDDTKLKSLQKNYGPDYITVNYKLTDRFNTSDGGGLYLIQKRYAQNINRVVSTSGAYLSVKNSYFYYLDLMVVKINNEGGLDWMTKIPMQKISQNYDPGRGFAAAYKEGSLYLLHSVESSNKEFTNYEPNIKQPRKQKSNNFLTVTQVDKKGVFRSEKLLDLTEERISFNTKRVAIDQINDRFLFMTTPRRWLGSQNKFVFYSVGF